jgi:hypothetical protein
LPEPASRFDREELLLLLFFFFVVLLLLLLAAKCSPCVLLLRLWLELLLLFDFDLRVLFLSSSPPLAVSDTGIMRRASS